MGMWIKAALVSILLVIFLNFCVVCFYWCFLFKFLLILTYSGSGNVYTYCYAFIVVILFGKQCFVEQNV